MPEEIKTDRELLQLAAKAARIDVEWVNQNQAYYKSGATWPDPRGWWSPLTDDGDALRLAVVMGRADRLGVAIHIVEPFDGDTGPYTWIDAEKFGEFNHYHGDDPFSATRRAIVEAAAEIGRRS